MKLTADVKMQIEAIKNPSRLNVIDYGDTVLLTDGWNDWINEYGNAFSYATEETKKAIIPVSITGEPLGIVLSVHVEKEDN